MSLKDELRKELASSGLAYDENNSIPLAIVGFNNSDYITFTQMQRRLRSMGCMSDSLSVRKALTGAEYYRRINKLE